MFRGFARVLGLLRSKPAPITSSEDDPVNFAQEIQCPVCEGIIGPPIKGRRPCKGGHNLAAFDRGYDRVGLIAAARSGSGSKEKDYILTKGIPPMFYDHADEHAGYQAALRDYGLVQSQQAQLQAA